MLFIFKILVFLFGISIGSFLNCLIYRLEKEKTVKGRSYCPKCGHNLSFFDLFPVISFIFLKGKCRYCKKKISFQYPLVEIFTGLFFLFVFNYLFLTSENFGSFQFIFEFLILIAIFSFLILIFVYDLKHYLIPDFAVYSIIIIAFIYNFLKENFINGLFSAIICFLFFLFIFLITKGKGMGFGDVKLSFFLGLFLGYPNFLTALFASFLIGAIIGLVLVFLKKKDIKSEIPFGPFLITGIIISFFWGDKIIYYYLYHFL